MNRVALLAVLLAACAPALRDPAVPTPTVDNEYARSVKVELHCPDGSVYGGSGIQIAGDDVLTAAHMTQCDDGSIGAVTVTDVAGKKRDAVVTGVSAADIARLEVPGLPPVSPVRVASTERGERVCAAFAYPERGRRCGEVWPARADTDHSAPGDVVVDFVAEQGSSGSGVWDADGRLVGILVLQRMCLGTDFPQVCTGAYTSLASRAWLAAP